jgi:uncharacterized membrane protein
MKILLLMLMSLSLNAATTYTKDAQPIFRERCKMCHDDFNMPDKNWMKYEIAKSKKDAILNRVWVKKDMPQANITEMTDKERVTIKNWVEEGAKE